MVQEISLSKVCCVNCDKTFDATRLLSVAVVKIDLATEVLAKYSRPNYLETELNTALIWAEFNTPLVSNIFSYFFFSNQKGTLRFLTPERKDISSAIFRIRLLWPILICTYSHFWLGKDGFVYSSTDHIEKCSYLFLKIFVFGEIKEYIRKAPNHRQNCTKSPFFST